MKIYESYECEFCGKEFEDKDECETHEFFCEIKALEKEQNMKIIMYTHDGTQLPFDSTLTPDMVSAIYVSDSDAIRMVKQWFDWKGYCHPWDCNWRRDDIKENTGLIVYDENIQEWFYPVDKIREMEEILKTFSDRG